MNTSVSDGRGDAADDPVVRRRGPSDPSQIGKFEIIGLLGAGGMGEVYLGAAGGRYAAVKLIRPQLVSPERFEREIAIMARVPPGVAPRLLAFDSTAARPWFAAEYVPGITLEQAVQGSGPLPCGALWLLLGRTAALLRKIHEEGIVHRDLKPANVILVPGNVMLIDFGIALDDSQERLTRNGASYGTPGFKAPEQKGNCGPVTDRADVYALGAMLAYAASGYQPDPDSGPDAGPLRRVDAALADVTESCLARKPWARPAAPALVEAARNRELARHPCWPQEVTSRIAARENFLTQVTTLPPETGSRLASEPPPSRPVMLTIGVAAGIASAILTAVVYGVAAGLESGLAAGLRAALLNGTVNGIGAGLAFSLMHGFAAQFTARRPPPRPSDASRFAALLLMLTIGTVIGAGCRLVLGPVPGLAAALMAAVGTGTMTAWGRWLLLARIWPPPRRATGKR